MGLHHLPALRQAGCDVVARADGVALYMRQLQFAVQMLETLLMQDGQRHAAESVQVLIVDAGVPVPMLYFAAAKCRFADSSALITASNSPASA